MVRLAAKEVKRRDFKTVAELFSKIPSPADRAHLIGLIRGSVLVDPEDVAETLQSIELEQPGK